MNEPMKIFSLLLLALAAGLFSEGASAQCQAGMPTVPGTCVPLPDAGGGTYPSRTPRPPAARWDMRWGAIAIDMKLGKMGVAESASSKRMAERIAMASCLVDGGKEENCKLNLTAWGNGCGVVAWGASASSTATADTIEEAARNAVASCSKHTDDCQVYYSSCSYSVRLR